MGYKLLTLALTMAMTLTLTLARAHAYPPSPVFHCPYEGCHCNPVEIHCEDRNLTSLPVLKDGHFTQTILYIQTNQISSISRGQLPKNLKQIFGLDNQISHISDDAFMDSANTLFFINLANNKLTRTPNLNYLNSLTHLFLHSNKITTVPVGSLPRSLRVLTLDDNELTQLPLALTTLTLTHLGLSDNHNMACTCDEAALADWYRYLPELEIRGDCYHDTTVVFSVRTFLRGMAPNCPKP